MGPAGINLGTFPPNWNSRESIWALPPPKWDQQGSIWALSPPKDQFTKNEKVLILCTEAKTKELPWRSLCQMVFEASKTAPGQRVLKMVFGSTSLEDLYF